MYLSSLPTPLYSGSASTHISTARESISCLYAHRHIGTSTRTEPVSARGCVTFPLWEGNWRREVYCGVSRRDWWKHIAIMHKRREIMQQPQRHNFQNIVNFFFWFTKRLIFWNPDFRYWSFKPFQQRNTFNTDKYYWRFILTCLYRSTHIYWPCNAYWLPCLSAGLIYKILLSIHRRHFMYFNGSQN
jgi:hypothetical protein